jgi:hypothetical protein
VKAHLRIFSGSVTERDIVARRRKLCLLPSFQVRPAKANSQRGVQNDRFVAHATTDDGYLGAFNRLRAVLNSATTASTSMLFAAANRSKVLLALFSDAMSASA